MLAIAFPLFQPETHIEAWEDCYISPSKITGFVCTFQFSNKKHIHYGLNDIKHLLIEANRRKKDVYLSLNAFEHGYRTADKLKQIRNIGIDIDCYKLGVSAERALETIKQLIFASKIPNPNLFIRSGRGIQIIYSISGGAAPKMAFLTKYITSQYIGMLSRLGADTSATDVTRVFRLPGSINSKSNTMVQVEIWNNREFHLEELYSYCTPIERRRKPPKRQKGTLVTLPSKPGIRTTYTLNSDRKEDLELLVTLRHGEIEKRNVMTYIYSYTVALNLKNQQQTIDFARQLNDRFSEPQKKGEVDRTAINAYKDAMKFFDEYAKRDFKMWYKMLDGIKRPMKTATVIEELDITTEEQRQMKVTISQDVKYERKVKKRRDEGKQERSEYLTKEYNKTASKLEQLQQAIEQHPDYSNYKLAELLGISEGYVRKLKKKI